jgi:acetyl-CoA acetyltransferase
MKTSSVYIVAALRTPIGSFGGMLKDFSATRLGALVIRQAMVSTGMPLQEVNDVLMYYKLTSDKHLPGRQRDMPDFLTRLIAQL